MWGKRGDMIVHEEDPYNAEPPRSALDPNGLTPVDTFYVRGHGPVPAADAATWTVRVDGMVERPTTLSLHEMRQLFVEHTEVATLQCAGNRREGLLAVGAIPGEAPWGPAATATARWSGVRLADLLRHVGADPAATDVAFLGSDVSTEPDEPEPFGGSVPIRKARQGEVLLAWSMNGEPLAPIHGAPLRVVVPGYIGARSIKWLDRITVQDRPSQNFFQAKTYRLLPPDAEKSAGKRGEGFELGLVAVNADVVRPEDGAAVPLGPTAVSGYAFAGGDRTIARVDVSTDGGSTWVQARLGEQLSQWSWRAWDVTVDVTDGTTEVLARAWDSSGALQPERPEHVWNPKGYANNSWARLTLHGVSRGGLG